MKNLMDKYPRVFDLLSKAKKRLPHFASEYLFSGTGYDLAIKNNTDILKNIFLTPKYVQGVVDPNLKVNLFGDIYDAPFGVAPVGLTGLIWPRAEKYLAKMSVKNNIPFTLSTVACASIEDTAKHLNGRGWFQLYPPDDKSIRNDLLKRAKNSNYKVLVVTADIPASSRRERLRLAGVSVPPKNSLRTFYHAAIRPSWSFQTLTNGLPKFGTMDQYTDGNWHGTEKVKAGFAGSQMKRFLDWDYLKEVKDIWKGPVVLKGIMHSDDAVKASRIVDCIYLSNHGGRQLDLAPSPIQILPEVRRSLKKDFPIIIDSGFYSGQDMCKAIMLGANFVMTGRPFFIGIAALGEIGAQHIHDIIKDEIQNVMEQVCCKDIKSLPKEKLSINDNFYLRDLN